MLGPIIAALLAVVWETGGGWLAADSRAAGAVGSGALVAAGLFL